MVIREFFQIFSTKTDLRKTLCSTLSSHRMYVQRVYTLYHQKTTNVHFVSKIIRFETFFSINSYRKTITFHNKLISYDLHRPLLTTTNTDKIEIKKKILSN